ncbi:hypothetical protein BB560_006022, partial [Smittium megazygosporum]
MSISTPEDVKKVTWHYILLVHRGGLGQKRAVINICPKSNANNSTITVNRLFKYINDFSKPLSVDSIIRYIYSVLKIIERLLGTPIPKARAVAANLSANNGAPVGDIIRNGTHIKSNPYPEPFILFILTLPKQDEGIEISRSVTENLRFRFISNDSESQTAISGLGRRVGQLDAGQTENVEYQGTKPDQSPHSCLVAVLRVAFIDVTAFS